MAARTQAGTVRFHKIKFVFHGEPQPGKRTLSPELPPVQGVAKVRFRTPCVALAQSLATNHAGALPFWRSGGPWHAGDCASRALRSPCDNAVNGYVSESSRLWQPREDWTVDRGRMPNLYGASGQTHQVGWFVRDSLTGRLSVTMATWLSLSSVVWPCPNGGSCAQVGGIDQESGVPNTIITKSGHEPSDFTPSIPEPPVDFTKEICITRSGMRFAPTFLCSSDAGGS
jgi:hypothetical protein